MDDQLATINQVKSTLIDLAIKFGPKLFTAVLILVVGGFVSRWASRWISRALRRIELEPPVRTLLARIAWVVVFGLFFIMALQNLGIQLLPLIAGLGVAGAGVALAMQGVLGNLVAGLTIIFTKPYRVGEYISIVGEEGRVDQITLFSTILAHNDRSWIVIPNRKIVGEILHNHGTIRQLDLIVGVAYDTDVDTAIALLNAVVQSNPGTLKDPAPVINTVRLAESAVQICVKPWVKVPDHDRVRGEINAAILQALRAKGIEIPFPQCEVTLTQQAA